MNGREHLTDDLRAGVVVFLVALPLCLGVALASGAPLFSGLIAGIAGGIVVTLVSRSRHGVSGPAAGLAVMVAAGIETLGFEAYLLAVVICGVVQLAAAFLKAGVIAHYFPSSVIKGMLAGIGIILILKQIPHALGYDHSWEGELEFLQRDGHNTFTEIGYALQALSPGAIIVTALSLTILLSWQHPVVKRTRVGQALPAPLLVVLLGIMLNRAFAALARPLDLQGSPRERSDLVERRGVLLAFHAPRFLSARQPRGLLDWPHACAHRQHRDPPVGRGDRQPRPGEAGHSTNLELKAQGLGNIVSGLLGGIPLTQVIVRSTANIESGGKTRRASFIHGVLLLICVATIPGLLNEIPLACLAAILLVIGYRLARVSLFKRMWREGLWQFLPFIVTVVGLVFTDLLKGIMLGMLVAFFEILIYNYQINFYREETAESCLTIRLTEHMTFLNKAALKRILREGSTRL